MLKHLCQEQPKEWDRFIPALLFAIREVPQESLKFSPFELLYGRSVRGPMQILKELWTKEECTDETRTTFQYVVDLRNRIEQTCELARENLKKASDKQAKHFNKKTRDRKFHVGDKVLILLPNKTNKLQMTWRGPYIVTDKVNECDYKVLVDHKEKTYHANILKKYMSRVDQQETHIVATIIIDEPDDACDFGQKEGIPLVSLKKKEGLEDVKFSPTLTTEQKNEAMRVSKEYERVLSDLPGKTGLAECEVRQETDTPVHVRQYPLPYSKVEVIKKEVDTMLKMGVIEPAASPYNAPVVLVKKKDGEYRFCVDYRKLNQATVFDSEPMPDIDQLFSKLSKKKFFTKLDLTKGFWQIPMKESDKEKTAFTAAQGQFQWTTMPFGLKNAGAVFSRMMRKLLRPLDQESVSNFMDDVMIATETWDQHIRVLRRVLQRLAECNLRAKPSKCHVGFKELSFLGHEIAEGTIRPEEGKIQKILEAKPPRTKKELRAFLGLAGYYRKFVPDFATVALPLTDRTKKGQPEQVVWDENCEAAFKTLKRKLCEKPVMCIPDVERPFVLRTDASDRGIGAVLMQEQGHGLQPIAYASKKLSSAENHYATIEKECLAVVWGIKKFQPYLFGTSFVLETDHQPLLYLRKAKTENGRLMRWAIQLQQYDFTVKVIPGKDNVGADYLSRCV
jgi:archaeosine-15-forming tRNA-guanine transglycosylase